MLLIFGCSLSPELVKVPVLRQYILSEVTLCVWTGQSAYTSALHSFCCHSVCSKRTSVPVLQQGTLSEVTPCVSEVIKVPILQQCIHSVVTLFVSEPEKVHMLRSVCLNTSVSPASLLCLLLHTCESALSLMHTQC